MDRPIVQTISDNNKIGLITHGFYSYGKKIWHYSNLTRINWGGHGVAEDQIDKITISKQLGSTQLFGLLELNGKEPSSA